jgi:DNA replication and repair protein RecF
VHVRHLALVDFRSWSAADLVLEPGPTAIVGPNGQGKTNLLEALGYLADLRSHRVATDAPLVRAGAERAVVRALVGADERELRLELEIVPGRANRARIGSAQLPRTRDIAGVLRTVMFAPEDLAIVQGDPGERRAFDYERVLKQRAALLKSAAGARRAGDAQLHTLDVWDGHLAEHGAELLHARLTTLQELRPHAQAGHAQFAPGSEGLRLSYRTSLSEDLPGIDAADTSDSVPPTVPPVAVLSDALLGQLARARPNELERGVNLVGPHRDDLELSLGERPVRGFASQGESWSVALALRVGSYELLRADELPGGDPVLLLDDVFAHLDAERREQLARLAEKAEQVLVTAAVPADVPAELTGARYRAEAGVLERDG